MTEKTVFTYASADGESTINAICWAPDGITAENAADAGIHGIIQFVHGMVEFIDRYDTYARELADAGYIVCGNDHIGHGFSVATPDDWGHMSYGKGAKCLVADVNTLRSLMQEKYGTDLPYYLYGHSMGSFVTRSYLATPAAAGLAGAIISGTGNVAPAASKAGHTLVAATKAVKGEHHRSNTVNNMAIGGYNKTFEPGAENAAPDDAGTGVEWLSRDPEVCRAYAAEPRNNFMFTLGGFEALFSLTAEVATPACAAKIDKNLPILFISGDKDPVGGFGKDVKAAGEMFHNAGIADVTVKLYPGARHELHNETNRDDVRADVLAWLASHGK